MAGEVRHREQEPAAVLQHPAGFAEDLVVERQVRQHSEAGHETDGPGRDREGVHLEVAFVGLDTPLGRRPEVIGVAVDTDQAADAEALPDPAGDPAAAAADVEHCADRARAPAGELVDHAVEIGQRPGLSADLQVVGGDVFEDGHVVASGWSGGWSSGAKDGHEMVSNP